MNKKELEEELVKKLEEIRNMYYEAYPEGNYLTLAIFRDFMHISNSVDEDKAFPIDIRKADD